MTCALCILWFRIIMNAVLCELFPRRWQCLNMTNLSNFIIRWQVAFTLCHHHNLKQQLHRFTLFYIENRPLRLCVFACVAVPFIWIALKSSMTRCQSKSSSKSFGSKPYFNGIEWTNFVSATVLVIRSRHALSMINNSILFIHSTTLNWTSITYFICYWMEH